MRYIIVDDESIAHDIIKKYGGMVPNMQLVGDCYDAFEAIELLSKQSVDLIFLDLNMPKLQGFDFLKTLPFQPKVIVTTAYKEFALESYELNVVDYLLKPFSFERFLKAINKATMDQNQTVGIANKSAEKEIPDRIFIQANNKHIQVNLNDLLYVEAAGNYVKIVLKEEVISMRGKISSILELLPSEGFIQVHRSFVVAQKHIKSIEGNQLMIDKYSVPIGKLYKLAMEKILSK
ncbi:MAG: response regulator transcription factor [Saprospiraceae bacterium]|nr:response regulator transcription factor [Saprospiraceae bacterium]